MHLSAYVTAEGEETDITVYLQAGSSTASDVKLVGDDAMYAEAYGEREKLRRERGLLGINDFYDGLLRHNESGETVRISIERTEDVSATETSVELPPRLFLTSQGGIIPLNIDDAHTITWEQNYDGQVLVTRYLACENITPGEAQIFDYQSVEINDVGISEISFRNFFSQARLDEVNRSRDCEGDVVIRRTTEGTIDPNLKGGRILGTQLLSQSFTVSF